MKRVHVSITVSDLDASREFYTQLFGHVPTMERKDYVQWMLDDPRVNFVIETGCGDAGVSHLGVQAETEAELDEQYAHVAATGGRTLDEGKADCCYARSTKTWVADPDGVRWENFLTHERTEDYGSPSVPSVRKLANSARCC